MSCTINPLITKEKLKNWKEKLECIQYNARLALTGAIRCTSKEKIYQRLGLEYLQNRDWCRKL